MPACYDLDNRYDVTGQTNTPRYNRYYPHYPTAIPALEVYYVTCPGAERHASAGSNSTPGHQGKKARALRLSAFALSSSSRP